MPTFSAPAKINLFLHITGKRSDGYHLLDSLVVFADGLSDTVSIEPADSFSFTVSGEFSGAVPEDNLVTRAAAAMAQETGMPPHVRIHLEKNIPAGAGLGGGSADAAATIRALENLWGCPLEEKTRARILLSLGADVAACYHAKPCRFSGIGEIIEEVPPLPTLFMLIIWPGAHSETKAVFAYRTGDFTPSAVIPSGFEAADDFVDFLKTTQNDLTQAATKITPVIAEALDFVTGREGCSLARMSGSGSAVFGIFSSPEMRDKAAEACKAAHPYWLTHAVYA